MSNKFEALLKRKCRLSDTQMIIIFSPAAAKVYKEENFNVEVESFLSLLLRFHSSSSQTRTILFFPASFLPLDHDN